MPEFELKEARAATVHQADALAASKRAAAAESAATASKAALAALKIGHGLERCVAAEAALTLTLTLTLNPKP